MIYLTLAYFLVGAVVLYWVHRRYAPERDPDVDWWIMLFPDSMFFAVVLLAIWPISVFYVRSEANDRARQLRSKELTARRRTECEAEARAQERQRWIGRVGIATSPLSPTGRATFDNEHVEVRSAYQFIEKPTGIPIDGAVLVLDVHQPPGWSLSHAGPTIPDAQPRHACLATRSAATPGGGHTHWNGAASRPWRK